VAFEVIESQQPPEAVSGRTSPATSALDTARPAPAAISRMFDPANAAAFYKAGTRTGPTEPGVTVSLPPLVDSSGQGYGTGVLQSSRA
jgi:hypothetical protein